MYNVVLLVLNRHADAGQQEFLTGQQKSLTIQERTITQESFAEIKSIFLPKFVDSL